MEKKISTTTVTRTNKNRGLEENTLAILDSSGVKDARDVDDDRLAFLEAVRVSSVVPESGTVPSNKMFEAIFQILRTGTSVELTMTSYQLLIEIDKRFPRVYLSDTGKSKNELVVVGEAWSPFALGQEGACSERDDTCGRLGHPLDSSGLFLLTQNIAQDVSGTNFRLMETKLLPDMMLFQYLINVLERDFLPRHAVYRESANWIVLRESLLNILLGSRRMSYKSLIKCCMTIIYKGSRAGFGLHDGPAEKSSEERVNGSEAALSITLSQLGKGTSIAVQKLMTLIMELDIIKKQADMEGYTSRADGVRSPLVEIIVDELTYNKDLISPFLQVFSECKWKLEIVLQYFQKYLAKPSVRTRRSNNSIEDATLDGVLKCFSSNSSTRNITKKINAEVAQLLLAHAFQAYISTRYPVGHNVDSSGDASLIQTCTDLILAFRNLKKINEDMEISPLGKEALLMAIVIAGK